MVTIWILALAVAALIYLLFPAPPKRSDEESDTSERPAEIQKSSGEMSPSGSGSFNAAGESDPFNECFIRVSGYYVYYGGELEFLASLTMGKIAASVQRASMAEGLAIMANMMREEGSPEISQDSIDRCEKLRNAINERDWSTQDARKSRQKLARLSPEYEMAIGGITRPTPEVFPSATDQEQPVPAKTWSKVPIRAEAEPMGTRTELFHECFDRCMRHYIRHGGNGELLSAMLLFAMATDPTKDECLSRLQGLGSALMEAFVVLEGTANLTCEEARGCFERAANLKSMLFVSANLTYWKKQELRWELADIYQTYHKALGLSWGGLRKCKPDAFPRTTDLP